MSVNVNIVNVWSLDECLAHVVLVFTFELLVNTNKCLNLYSLYVSKPQKWVIIYTTNKFLH